MEHATVENRFLELSSRACSDSSEQDDSAYICRHTHQRFDYYDQAAQWAFKAFRDFDLDYADDVVA